MTIATNIVRRKGSLNFYVRVTIPNELRASLGKREIWKSLGTSSRKEAISLSHAVLADIQKVFAGEELSKEPTAADLKRAVQCFEWRELEYDLGQRNSWLTESQFNEEQKLIYEGQPDGDARAEALRELNARKDEPNRYKRTRAGYETQLRKDIAVGEIAHIQWAADHVIELEHFLLDRGSSTYRALCHVLLKSELKILQKVRARDGGEFEDSVAPPPKSVGPRLATLIAEYAAERAKSDSADTQRRDQAIIKLFVEFVGDAASLDIVEIMTRARVRDWKQGLKFFPVKAGENKKLRDLKFAEVVAANQRLEYRVISTRTFNKYLSALRGFCHWLRANAHIEIDPVADMYLPKDHEKLERSYKTAELIKIFASPLYTGCQTSTMRHLPGDVRIRDHRFWMPLIALYTGARMNEIAQLEVEDMKQLHGRWVFHITKGGPEKKTVKTAGSERVVPVHSMLIRLGLLEHHANAAKAGSLRIFSEIKRDTRGSYSGYPSRDYGKYLTHIGVKTDKSRNFHSYRHSFIDALRRAGNSEAEIALLTGHVKATMTAKYGTEKPGTLLQRSEWVEAAKYGDLDLSHLIPPAGDTKAAA